MTFKKKKKKKRCNTQQSCIVFGWSCNAGAVTWWRETGNSGAFTHVHSVQIAKHGQSHQISHQFLLVEQSFGVTANSVCIRGGRF